MARQSPNEIQAEVAFQFWVNDGIHFKNYEEVANACDVSVSTIHNWRKRFNWDRRVNEITKKVNENIKRATEDRVLAGCEYYLRGIDDIFAEYVRQVMSGERKVSDEYMVKFLELGTEIQRGKYMDREQSTKADTTLSDFMSKLGEVLVNENK